MQTSAKANRLTAVAHGTHAVLPDLAEQFVVDDQRLRNWKLAVSGGLTYANPVRAVLNGNGEVVRIRTLEGSPYLYTGTLDVRYATPADSMTWSSNTLSAAALSGGGVDLYVNGNTLDAFWIDSDAATIKTAHSTDGGHTWGAAATVATIGAQAPGVLAQLCAPAADTLIYSSSTIGSDMLTGIYIVNRIAGVWQTPTLWDLGGQPLGIETPVTLPDTSIYPSNLSGVRLSDGRLELAYYGNELRETYGMSTWVQRIGNYDAGAATQHLHWTHPFRIYPSVGIDDDNNSTQVFECFPRLQMVGAEYWIVALEISKFAGHERYYLVWHRSTDGIYWSDRDTHQGAANDDFVGAHVYDGDTAFLLTDLIYANIVFNTERTMIVGFDKVFYCPSTTLVGVDNPLRQQDLTAYADTVDIELSAQPAAGDISISASNLEKFWSDEDLVTAHRGVRVLATGGYVTENGDELLDIGQFWIDEVTQHSEPGDTNYTIRGIDSTMYLDRWKADIYHEYQGPEQIALDQICDLTPFTVIFGSYVTGPGGRLKSGIVRKADNFHDDILSFNQTGSDGMFVITRFRCDRDWTGEHVGVVFQGQDLGNDDDNKNYWAVLYNRTSPHFTINQAIPRTNPNKAKLYKYLGAVATSDEVDLDAGTWYWLMVGVWHGHVMAWYTDDVSLANDPTWTKVLDYTSPATPAASVLPCRIGWNGLSATQKVRASGPTGNVATNGGMQVLADSGSSYYVALKITLDSDPSILRRVNCVLTQENDSNTDMPDAFIVLANGDDNHPGDVTDDDNIIFTRNASSLHFSSHDKPKWLGANPLPNPAVPIFSANEVFWLVVSVDGDLTTGQSYKWGSGGTGNCQISTDGVNWSTAPGVLAANVEVEYINGRVKFHKLYVGTGEPTYTYENLAHEFASKAGVLDIVPDDFVNSSELVLGGDNIYWQPESYGTLSDMVLEADVEVDLYGTARIFVGSTDTGAGDGNTNIVELSAADQTISFYKSGNTLLSVAQSLQYIPDTFHVQVVNQNSFLYVYLNECLAGLWYNAAFATDGYVGVDSVGATFTNLRVPDLHQMTEYASVDAGQSALEALSNLMAKPAAGTSERVKYFVNYESKLRIGSFNRRSVVDTYEDTLLSADKTETGQNIVSVQDEEGNYYAKYNNPKVLDTDGRWYSKDSITDALTDEDAYKAAQGLANDQKELAQTHNITHLPVWAAEREDLNLVINPTDQTVQELIINSIHWHIEPSNTQSQVEQTISYRQFVED